ncbi:hypothetical protein DFH08DRAFT_1003907 [Mycena albidolilacea]|uniref:F-box domain-containing protein n=1 Tax=Mycena albidolilacea TaxID=1033008 RepID=A0AAD7F548_9AGAR|nr:hypothetical protein DFH08DRAFT_1003907 [Mycena albidolilacea]
MDVTQSFSDPLMRFPPEIASKIFGAFPYSDFNSRFRVPAALRAPLVLLHVCRYWKDVAFPTPGLWTDLVFCVNGFDSEIRIPCSAPQGPELCALFTRSSPPLVDLDLFTACLRLLSALSQLTLRGPRKLLQEDFIAVLADDPSLSPSPSPSNSIQPEVLLPQLTHLVIYVESQPDKSWFQRLVAML